MCERQQDQKEAGLEGKAPWRLGKAAGGVRTVATRMVVGALVLSLIAVGALMPRAAMAAGIGDLYAPPAVSGIGAGLWNGGPSVPGAPASQAGCAPTVQQAQGAAYAAAVQSTMTISKSERKPPGKILTSCITALITLMSSFDIFSNAGPWALNAIIEGVLNYAEQMVCAVIADQFNKLVQQAFNSVAFLADVIPCGVNISITGMSGGSGGMDFCATLGGPFINITAGAGSGGPQLYTYSQSSLVPPIISRQVGASGGNVLSTILGR